MAKDPYKYFRPEARDLVDQCAKGVLDIEKGSGGTAAVQRLLRVAHTLKGAARVVKQGDIADRAHAIEDLLTPYRDSGGSPAGEQIDSILQHLDAIGSRLAELEPEKGNTTAATAAETGKGPRTVRTDVAETESVLDGIAEAHTLLGGLRKTLRNMEQARRLSDVLLAPISASASPGQPLRTGGRAAASHSAMADELRRRYADLERDLGATADQMERELRQLREAAERLRLVPVDTIFTALERTARDTANALSKQVVFEASGREIRLDARVLEVIQGALIQIIRNAVAHGIESPSQRTALGKPKAGRIRVNVVRRGSKMAFECHDDGSGIDLDAVRSVARQRGLLGAHANQADLVDLMRMLLQGGISTSRTVTDVSGRGVGLDVVREAAERLGGDVSFRTSAGAGTTVTIVIPPSMTSMQALLVEAEEGGSTVAIPFDAIRSTLRIDAAEIGQGPSGSSLLFDGSAIPFVSLTAVIDGRQWSRGRNCTAIVVAGSVGMAAFGVERLVGTAAIVVRPLPDSMAASPLVAGAYLDVEGNPQLVLDPERLIAATRATVDGGAEAPAPGRPILVVDDSMTTRMLEKSILESAGHNVEVALSGEEALDRVRDTRFGLILVDVEMPGMDGFTFIERIRSDPQLREVPAILVSSRAAPEDLKRGRDVGAQGYMVKSEFDQAKLLSMIDRLMA